VRRGLVISLLRGMVRVFDPLVDKEGLPHGLFVSPALTPMRASELLVGEEAVWAVVFPNSACMHDLGASVLSVTTVTTMAVRACEVADLLAQFPEHVAAMRVPVRARWLRRRLRLVAEGARRVRMLLSVTRRLRSGAENLASFSDLIIAAANSPRVLDNGPTAERLRQTQRLLLTRRLIGEQHSNSAPPAEAALQLSLPLAVFIVSWAAPLRYRALVAAALTIQRVWRGALARQRLRLRIARARLSTRAMQRLASKLAGKEPAVVALETLRVVHKQLLSAMEQQEQVVSESMERSAVARERMRISQLGLASVRPNADRPFAEAAQATEQ